ncbi:cytochrome b N-terminal domain-containing protein [Glaciibacter psychrotolerans]|uniref:Cytochrome bc1 complex cytochrome b subunit n=1 Tax=Glaciibacter psychrotolerans TaxID=670054 RepID=A0A7Z0J5K7_9MICO|nr:cytochrome b N-terminal domain-containing protein [Leifsonia psychrotolerans]NYJ19505.1 ubiquinol-cytochrome c reductase cytochrome b subunit [Leifsonia psychrotolerans]
MSVETPAQTAGTDGDAEVDRSWTGRSRRWLLKKLPPDKLLPNTQPSYVASWIYVFGMGALAALIFIIASGVVLSLNGPMWYHLSAFGHFVNSVHLWSVELFFVFMVVHLWGKFWMAAWRGHRALTWITGVFSFAVSIVAAFTGYLVQTNFDAQWIAFEAKDALNATGIGAWFNVANLGQMLMWHITLLPLAVIVIVAMHVILVRMHGVVPPLEADESDAQLRDAELGDALPRAEASSHHVEPESR